MESKSNSGLLCVKQLDGESVTVMESWVFNDNGSSDEHKWLKIRDIAMSKDIWSK